MVNATASLCHGKGRGWTSFPFSHVKEGNIFPGIVFRNLRLNLSTLKAPGRVTGTCRQEHWESFSQCQISVENLNKVSEREKDLRKRGGGKTPGGRKSC